MIVTPEGLNVFPEDVERVLNAHARRARFGGGRRADRLGGARARRARARSRAPTSTPSSATANAQLDDHQKIRRALGLAGAGAAAHRRHAQAEARGDPRLGEGRRRRAALGRSTAAMRSRRCSRSTPAATNLSAQTTLEELGLSSLERVELMVALEDAFQTRIDEGAFAGAQDLGQLRALRRARRVAATRRRPSRCDFPAWNRVVRPRARSAARQPADLDPAARRALFAWLRVDGLEHLRDLDGPVIFAANHQSHMDAPVILAALPPRWRYRVAPAMAQGVLQGALLPARARPAGVVHQQPELLPRGALLQRVSAAAARGRRAADAALHRRGARRGDYSVLIFPGRPAVGDAARSTRSGRASA